MLGEKYWILLVCCSKNNSCVFIFNGKLICIDWIWQIADPPLKSLLGITTTKQRLKVHNAINKVH